MNAPSDPDTTWLTTAELARRWRMTPVTLRSWRARNKGPAYVTVGRKKVLYSLTEVLAYEAEQTKGAK